MKAPIWMLKLMAALPLPAKAELMGELKSAYNNPMADFHTAEAYCLRLAEVVVSLRDGEEGDARFRQELDIVLPAPPDENPSSVMGVFGLQARLYRQPDSQVKLARMVEYPTSRWLLEEELARYRPDAEPLRERTPIQVLEKVMNDGKAKYQVVSPPLMEEGSDVYKTAFNYHLRGICFSGGGIRSATFSLGILQGLARLDLFRQFDYLSTVSGGGYLHQCIATWIHRESFGRVNEALNPIPNQPGTPHPRTQPAEPLNWLRRYSNYLTPRKGLFSGDTWTMVAVWVRNTGLNLIVLISAFLSALLIPHLLLLASQMSLLRWGWFSGRSMSAGIAVWGLMAVAAALLSSLVMKVNERFSQAGSAGSGQILLRVLLPVAMVAICISPSTYLAARSAVPIEVHANGSTQIFARVPGKPQTGAASCALKTVSREPLTCRVRLGWTHHPALEQVVGCPKAGLNYAVIGFIAGVFVLVLGITRVWFRRDVWSLLGAWRRVGRVVSSLVIAVLCAVLAVLLVWGVELATFLGFFFCAADHPRYMGAVLVPLLLLAVPFLCSEIAIGLIGRQIDDAQREWLARLRALSFLCGLGWLLLGGFCFLGPWVFDQIAKYAVGSYAVWGSWLVTTVASLVSGKSNRTTGGPSDDKSASTKLMQWVAMIGPPVFIVGMFVLLAKFVFVIVAAMSSAAGAVEFADLRNVAGLLAGTTSVMLLFGWRVDINDFSMHGFYRDRLARCYSGAARSAPTPGSKIREPNNFTGFDPRDRELRLMELLPKRFSGERYEGPFPIICSTLNLTGGQELAYQERQGASFALTPLYCGYSAGWTASRNARAQVNRFVPTPKYVYTGKKKMNEATGISLVTATAISGAALNPNDGYNTNPAVAFLMTLFNVRLGWWLRNPGLQWIHGGKPSSPRFGLYHLLSELTAKVDDTHGYINLSDGGHFDDMGLYELVRRRCRLIVICDGECDADLSFDGLTQGIRKSRLDFGAEIQLDRISDLQSTAANQFHVVTGRVTYAEHPGMPGIVIYIKTSITGNEPADVHGYKHAHPSFPQQSTVDQWFTESQFESYRRLGQHIVLDHPEITQMLIDAIAKGIPPCPSPTGQSGITPPNDCASAKARSNTPIEPDTPLGT